MSAILKQKLIDIANGFTKYGLWKGGGSGGSSALSDMTDVTLTNLQANDVLKYNGSVWVNDDNLHEYSTEEKIVGKWIDGKSIYEKTIEFICPAYGFNNVIYEFTDFDKCIELSGFCQFQEFSYLNISSLAGYFEGGENVYEYFALTIKNKALYLTVSKGLNVLAGKQCYCTVKFTKTTN